MRTPEDVIRILHRKYVNNCKEWLAQALGSSNSKAGWPLRVPLDPPSEASAVRNLQQVAKWVSQWEKWMGPGQIDKTVRRWNRLGTQALPQAIIFLSPDEVARVVGEERGWRLARQRSQALIEQLGQEFAAATTDRFQDLASFSDGDFAKLAALLKWLLLHPRSGLYPRQIPVFGVDTKWLERHRSVLIGFMREGPAETLDELGLRRLPDLVRMRILDPDLRRRLGGLEDIAAPAGQLATLDLPAETVIIAENLQTGLAFEDSPGSVVVMGLGAGVSVLGFFSWIHRANVFYWGDLDTHGMAILAKARSCFPGLQSILMDELTLLEFRDLWGLEPDQCRVEVFEGLTTAEQEVYAGLRSNRWGLNVRLEQERIPWSYASKKLPRLVAQHRDDGSMPLLSAP